MDTLQLTHVPVMKTGLLLRKPVAEVYETFVNPAITTQFWFTGSSGRLEPGVQVEWAWEMYDVSALVTVKALEPNRRIAIEWPGYSGLTTVEWLFAPQPNDMSWCWCGIASAKQAMRAMECVQLDPLQLIAPCRRATMPQNAGAL